MSPGRRIGGLEESSETVAIFLLVIAGKNLRGVEEESDEEFVEGGDDGGRDGVGDGSGDRDSLVTVSVAVELTARAWLRVKWGEMTVLLRRDSLETVWVTGTVIGAAASKIMM
jgi:hypothetical protein